MCLGIPGEVVDIESGDGSLATVNVSGVERAIDVSMLDDLVVGDWVVVHLGFALARIDAADAHTLLRMLETGDPGSVGAT